MPRFDFELTVNAREAGPRIGKDVQAAIKAVKAGEDGARPVKVLFHSHLDVGAYFSETDAAAATMGGDHPTYDLFYLVTSVRSGEVDDHKLFAWDNEAKKFVETPMAIVS